MPKDYNARFQEILTRLAPDKKKELYNRMRSLPASEREGFIKNFVTKYDSIKKAKDKGKLPQKKVPAKPHGMPVHKPGKDNAPHARSEHKPGNDVKPHAEDGHKPGAKKVRPEPSHQPSKTKPVQEKNAKQAKPPKQEKPKKERPAEEKPGKAEETDVPSRKSPLLSKIIVGVLIALLGAGAVFITAINNREDINKLLMTIKGEPAATEASATENEYKIAASLAVQTEGATEETESTAPSPTPTPIVVKEDAPDLTGLVIVIDPGHQAETDYTEESLFPDSTVGKPRCTSGAVGVDINTKEYEVTLEVALVTKAYLESCGASVILTREVNDINLSNQERAGIAVAASPDIYIRLHADSAPSSDVSGVIVYVPDSGSYVDTDKKLGEKIGTLLAEAQGTEYLGCFSTNAYTGLNYASSVKSVQVVMGFLSNSEDEARLNDDANTYEIAAAIAQFCSEL